MAEEFAKQAWKVARVSDDLVARTWELKRVDFTRRKIPIRITTWMDLASLRYYPSFSRLFVSSSLVPSVYIFYLFVRSSLPLLPRVFLSYAGRSAGSMDGRYLFFVTRNCDPVFLEGSANYARHRPPTVSRTVVLKKKKEKRKKEKKSVFILRTHSESETHGGGWTRGQETRPD